MNALSVHSTENNRIRWIDTAKGFTAILVVLGHDIKGMLDENLIASSPVPWIRVVDWIYCFHMFLFFFLSGFLFYYSVFAKITDDCERKKKYRIHVWNYIIVYLVFSVLFWLSRILLSSHVRIQVSWNDLIKMPIVPMEMLWFLWVLIVFYFIGFYILRYFEKRNRLSDQIWLFAFLLLSFASGFLRYPQLLNNLYKVAYYSVAFFAGIYYCKHKPVFLQKRFILFFICFVSLAVSGVLLFTGWNPSTIPILNTVVAFFLSMTFICILQRSAFKQMILQRIGKHALEIYLLQHYVIAIDRRLIKAVSLPVNFITVIISTSIEIAIPVLIGLLLKKVHLYAMIFHPLSWYMEKRTNSL